ncbi:hypothetical protein [Nocardia sp. NPDC050435]|uniref:hypothetical protein n=1 Tax=Nocardia sp. NPDC050435 TaxID=3155040 RepID=UPI0033C474AD
MACAAAVLLVSAAFVVPRLATERWRDSIYAAAAPIFGHWYPHVGWGTVPALAIAAAVVLYGPALAARLSWPRLLLATWGTAFAWAFALAMVDGWKRGFTRRLTSGHEYLYEVPGVHDIPAMVRGFAGRILDYQPDSWTTHVSGHPPGALLVFVWLDRIGLGGGAWAALVCVLAGTSATAAVLVAIRALGAPGRARAAAPYLALAPAAIWIAVSADALFAGVTAWAVALLAVATDPRRTRPGLAALSGLLFGFGLFLNYGLVLMAIPALFVLAVRGLPGVRAALPALAAVVTVVAAFAVAGFWWVDGYHLVVERYYQGIATTRPWTYWVWGNLAATVCAVGLAAVAALPLVFRGLRLPDPRALADGRGAAAVLANSTAALRVWRTRLDPAAVLAVGGLVALLAADLSGLSKAETERIWLPFEIWVLAGTALLPRGSARGWLAVQAGGALVLAHLLMTNW